MKWLEQALLIVSTVWHEEVVWEELKLKLRWPYDLTELCVSHLWKVCSLKFWWNRIIDVRAQYVQPVLQLMTFCWSNFEWKWFAEWTSLKWKPILYQEAWQVRKGKNWKVPFISLNMLPPPELIIVNESSRYRLIIEIPSESHHKGMGFSTTTKVGR